MSDLCRVQCGPLEISFGNQANSPLKVKELRDTDGIAALTSESERANLARKLPLNTVFLHQTHGILGVYLDTLAQLNTLQNLITEGDYLISNLTNLGLGILTADCLPLVIYDPLKNIVAVAHAGWRGSVAGIGPVVLKIFQNQVQSDLSQLQVWFGPAAGACCYEVQPDFQASLLTDQAALLDHNLVSNCFNVRAGRLYFDLASYNYELLLRSGILGHNVNRKFNLCTICNPQFCSYRRDGLESGLQVTKVLLKP